MTDAVKSCRTCACAQPTTLPAEGIHDMKAADIGDVVRCVALPPAATYPSKRLSQFPVVLADDYCRYWATE